MDQIASSNELHYIRLEIHSAGENLRGISSDIITLEDAFIIYSVSTLSMKYFIESLSLLQLTAGFSRLFAVLLIYHQNDAESPCHSQNCVSKIMFLI